ncbi:MAG: YjjG family noncanonical pyrimidine nucleotidase [Bacteroidales bacterium]
MSTYKHIFFDLDRTLWDFEANSLEAFKDLFDKYNLNSIFPDLSSFHKLYRQINKQLWQDYREGLIEKQILIYKRFYLTLKHFGHDDLELAKQIGDDYVSFSAEKTKLFPYAHEALGYLKNKYYLYIITNGFEEVQYKKIRNCHLEQYFKKIITSEKAGVQKPHQRIFKYALSLANANQENSLMVGDDFEGDIRGAKAVGIDQIYFNPNQSPTTVEKATYEIDSLLQLVDLL